METADNLVMSRRDLLVRGALACTALGVVPRAGWSSSAPVALGGRTDAVLHLNWNENPLGMAPSARRAAAEAVTVGHRYPDAWRSQLIEALAAQHRLATGSIVLSNGSTEMLQVVTQALAPRRPTLVLAEPTFSIVLRYQRPFEYRVERVPLDSRHAHDLEKMRSKATGPSLVYLCNPNNPTGTLTPTKEIDRWLELAPDDVLFLIDEAYAEFVDDAAFHSAIRWVGERRNVVVTRTFSKVYGMAGMRLGYAVAHPETAEWLRSHTPTDNANGPALAAALVSLADEPWLAQSLESNRRAKEITVACLKDLDLEVLPSHTNFVMHRIQGQLDAYMARMREAGIRVGRPFPPMLSYNRLTLGLPEQMERFAAVMQDFRQRGWV